MQNEHLIKYKNSLILKEEEGKGKPTVYDLPPAEHAYGKKMVDDPEPIKHIVHGWCPGELSEDPSSKRKDFQELNRQAITQNIHTAKQQKDFRATNDIMVKVKKGKQVIPIYLPQEDFVYGVPNRPSTPVKLVIGQCYALEEEQKQQEKYLHETQKMEQSKGSRLQAKKTKSQALREEKAQQEKQYQMKPNIDQKFKLSKFTSTGAPRINTNLQKTEKSDSNSQKADKPGK